MYVRLAFAVAAHHDPEILLIDEVLAVGDIAFQRKCFARIGDVAYSGRTVLLVSHNMASVEALCKRAILIGAGALIFNGPASQAVQVYLSGGTVPSGLIDLSERRRGTEAPALLRSITVSSLDGTGRTSFPIGATVVLSIEIYSEREFRQPQIGIGVNNSSGLRLFTVSTTFAQQNMPPIRGRKRVRCVLPNLTIAPGEYNLKVTFGDTQHDYDVVDGVVAFQVVGSNYLGAGRLPVSGQGVTVQAASWILED